MGVDTIELDMEMDTTEVDSGVEIEADSTEVDTGVEIEVDSTMGTEVDMEFHTTKVPMDVS